LLFLTADHAGAENAQFLADNKYNVKAIEPKEITKGLKKFSVDTFGDDLVQNYSSFNLFFDKEKIKSKNLDLTKIKEAFINYLMSQEQVKRVYTEEEIKADNGSDYYLHCIAKGYDSSENGDLVILDKPAYIEYGKTGTSHGTAYSYDTHVPLLFFGWNIKPGENYKRKEITEIAPTLAQKIKVAFPNATEAEVLFEILNSK